MDREYHKVPPIQRADGLWHDFGKHQYRDGHRRGNRKSRDPWICLGPYRGGFFAHADGADSMRDRVERQNRGQGTVDVGFEVLKVLAGTGALQRLQTRMAGCDA